MKNNIHPLTSAAEPAESNWEPSSKQIDFLNAGIRCGLNRNVAAVCRDAGVSRVAFYNWLKQPGFAAAWAELPRKVISAHLPGVVAAVVRKAQEGDVAAARLLFQAAGLIGRDAVAGVQGAVVQANRFPERRYQMWAKS